MRRDLHGRTILVTGASRGIGRCVAERLAGLGARLVLAARSETALAELAGRLKEQGKEALPVAVDLTTPEGRERLVRETQARFGGLDVLVNNAGVAASGPFATSSEDVLRRVMELNFFAPVELTRLCVPLLTRSAEAGFRPAVVNVASICGRRGIPSLSEHCASKFALVGMSEALRGEFARFGIDVTVVLPGLVRAEDRRRHLLRDEGCIRLDWDAAAPADSVARAVVAALRRGQRERVVGWTARWIWRGRQFVPWLLDRVFARKVRNYSRCAGKSETRNPKPETSTNFK